MADKAIKKDHTESVEHAWRAPLRRFAPALILISLTVMLTSALLYPVYSMGHSFWSPQWAVVLGVIYLGLCMLALYFISLASELDFLKKVHLEETQRLARGREQLRTALDHITDGVIATDQEGRVALMNHKACELTGWAADEAKGKSLREVFRLETGENPAPDLNPHATVRLGRGPFQRVEAEKLFSRDDCEYLVSYEPVPMIDSEGWLVGTMLAFRDVSDLKHAEEQREELIAELSETNSRLEAEISHRERARRAALNLLQDAQQAQSALREREEHLRVLFEGIDDTLLVYDSTGHFLDCNQAACANLGYNREELLAHPKDDIIIPGEADTPSMSVRTKKGELFPVDVHSSGIHYHGYDATLAVMRDISPLKKIEDELRRSNERLRESNAALEEYARVASHDLQEPLRKIESFSRIVLEDYGARMDDEGRHYLDILSRAATRMRRLIKDVLAFSRAGAEDRPMRPVDLNIVLRGVMENLSSRIEERGAEVTLRKLPTVNGDQTQMSQLFQNLLSNSLKFNDKQVPAVEVTAEEAGTEWLVTVKDNGIGMKPWELRYIFAPFKRIHGREKYEGTGIGLAVCRKIIHRHGGTITVESQPGEGSLFKLTFPRVMDKTEISETIENMEPASMETRS